MPLRLLRHRTCGLLLLPMLTAPLVTQAQPSRISQAAGEWVFVMDGDQQPQRVVLTPDGDTLRGRVSSQAFGATLAAQRLAFRVGDFRWRGTLKGDSLAG